MVLAIALLVNNLFEFAFITNVDELQALLDACFSTQEWVWPFNNCKKCKIVNLYRISMHEGMCIGGFHVASSSPCWWTVNKRPLISSLCLSTSICSFHHCYLCLPRLHENHLLMIYLYLYLNPVKMAEAYVYYSPTLFFKISSFCWPNLEDVCWH